MYIQYIYFEKKNREKERERERELKKVWEKKKLIYSYVNDLRKLL